MIYKMILIFISLFAVIFYVILFFIGFGISSIDLLSLCGLVSDGISMKYQAYTKLLVFSSYCEHAYIIIGPFLQNAYWFRSQDYQI